MGTSGAGWEAPEDPLDRDPPRPRGVAWPRLRRSRSAQGDAMRKTDLNQSNLHMWYLFYPIHFELTIRYIRYELEVFLREDNFISFQKLIQGEA